MTFEEKINLAIQLYWGEKAPGEHGLRFCVKDDKYSVEFGYMTSDSHRWVSFSVEIDDGTSFDDALDKLVRKQRAAYAHRAAQNRQFASDSIGTADELDRIVQKIDKALTEKQ